jgi:maltose O-acetyltransferase
MDIKRVFQAAIYLASELEAILSRPNDRLRLRRRFLRMMDVKHRENLFIGRSFRLLCPGNLSLGERCAIGDFARIINHAPVTIGDDFTGSAGLHIETGDHDPVTLIPQGRPITIGHRVWCGVNVTIMAGVTIGDDVVIGVGAVVCHDIPPNSIAVGIPAKVIKPLGRPRDQKLWTWVS